VSISIAAAFAGSTDVTRIFVVGVPRDDVDIASDRLWTLGVRGIEERELDDGTVELRVSVGESPSAVERASSRLDPRWRWRVEDVDDRWEQAWRDHARPIAVGRSLIVVPAWLNEGVGATVPGGGDNACTISIEPRDTFGLGDHPTTQLTLRALEGLLWTDASVLDVGCGSGVLSIAARLLGAGAVRAIDVSMAAVETTKANAMSNGIDGLEVGTTPIADIAEPADIVLANVLAPEIVAMAQDLRRVTAHRLVVSGVLADGHRHVLDALAPMQVLETSTADGWAAITLAPS
jgi:ribosomal protein L11 methyltransferase